MSRTFYLRRRWKPPFLVQQFAALTLAVFLLPLATSEVHVEGSGDVDVPEHVDLKVEKTPFSLTFSVVDTENFELQNVTCKSKKNVETVANENRTCEHLDPCSTYFIVLSIKKLNEENQPVIEVTRDETTEYNKPVVSITSIVPSTESINMTWSAESQSCISSFIIEANSDDKAYKWTMTNEQTNLTMEGLSPCQEYNISLKTYDNSNAFISNTTSKIETEYEEPGEVTMKISNSTNAQMKVSWELLSHSTCVQFYYLKWSLVDCPLDIEHSVTEQPTTETPDEKSDECEWFKELLGSTTKEYDISDLQGCEDYNFKLYINNLDMIKAEDTKKSPEQVPGAVTIDTIVVESTVATLNWNPPKMHRKCVHHYYVNITGPEERPLGQQKPQVTAREGTSVSFDELDPCGKYNYTIVPQSLNGESGSALTGSLKTEEGTPSAVRNYVVKSEPYALNISWEPPLIADLCLVHYRLVAWDDEGVSAFDTTTTNTTIRVDNLKACVGYIVQIVPVTASMEDGIPLQIESETSSKAASAPNVLILAEYPDRFVISAQESDLNNKCETIFARIVCKARSDAPIMIAEKYFKGQLVILFNTEIGPLSPYTEYACDTALYNIGGWSANKTFVKWTKSYYPEKPGNISVKTHTNNSLAFSWNTPKYPNGVIKLYITYFQRVEAAYFIPSKCSAIESDLKSQETSSVEQSFKDLLPYTIYSFQVAAQNEFGISESSAPIMEITKPWISDPITNLVSTPEGPSDSDTEYRANVILTWSSPCKSNGEIESFLLEFTGERQEYEQEQFSRLVWPDIRNDGSVTYNETNLKPEYSYTVVVAVKTRGVDILSTVVRDQFDAPAGIPKRLGSDDMEKARVEPYESSNPSKTAIVRFPADVLKSEYGTVIYVALILSQKDCDEETTFKYGAMDTDNKWPDIKSWNEVYEDRRHSECIKQYQTTPLRWKPATYTARSSEEIEFVIGTDDCIGSSIRFCNGPLTPDTEYNLIIRLFTKSGYNDAALLQFRTDALIELTIILAGVSSCLLLAFIAGFVYLWITKRIKWQRESCHGIEDSFGDTVSKKFALYYRELSKPEKIAREFKELTAVALDLSYSASEMGYNKNRYADIFPYDKNRVILDIDADGSDYINASFIDGYRRRKEYIATQGPKPESTMDFWRMVLQHNVRVVVMVTQFREGDVIKCHEYFPFKSKGINVNVKKKEAFDLYDRTELSVVHEMFGLKQKVVHFYFKKWPDHGCPTDPMHLITFVRKVKAEKIPSYSPIVVHCSAGVGRTGTFIGLDIIMQRLKNESKINIYETVKKLRFQRMKMVQTLAQYTFLYTCTFELVRHKLKCSDLKEEACKKRVCFDMDPENIAGQGLRTTSQMSRNGSDMSSLNEQRQSTIDRPANGTTRGRTPIGYGGTAKDKSGLDPNNESVM